MRTAAMIRWPGKIPAGLVTQQMLCAEDWLPTLAGIIGASNLVPKDRPIDGVDASAFMLGKSDTTGNPRIESAASGYNFNIYFYECEKTQKCGSLQFLISFADDGTNTPDLANKWNTKKRFLQMSVDDDKSLAVSMDVSTLGGLNQKNFADVIDWWSVMLGELAKFFKEQGAKPAA